MAKYIVRKAFKNLEGHHKRGEILKIEALDKDMFFRVKHRYIMELDPKNPKLLRKGVPISSKFIENAIKDGQRVDSMFKLPEGDKVLEDGRLKDDSKDSEKPKEDKSLKDKILDKVTGKGKDDKDKEKGKGKK